MLRQKCCDSLETSSFSYSDSESSEEEINFHDEIFKCTDFEDCDCNIPESDTEYTSEEEKEPAQK